MYDGEHNIQTHYQKLQAKIVLYFDLLFGAIHVAFLAVFSPMTSNPDNYGGDSCPQVLLNWGQYAFIYHAAGFILSIAVLSAIYFIIAGRNSDSTFLVNISRLIRLIIYLVGVAVFIGICISYNNQCQKLSQLCLAYIIIWSIFLFISLVVTIMVLKKSREHGMDTHSTFVSFVYFD
jgi:hypothetical protein